MIGLFEINGDHIDTYVERGGPGSLTLEAHEKFSRARPRCVRSGVGHQTLSEGIGEKDPRNRDLDGVNDDARVLYPARLVEDRSKIKTQTVQQAVSDPAVALDILIDK